MTDRADVVVLGMGAGGEELGLRLARAGLDVVGVERALLGGECPYWACIPSKMMIRAANLLQEARRVNGVASRAEVTLDWAPVAARIRAEATSDWDDGVAVARFEREGGRFVRGRGALTGPRTVSADGRSFTAERGIVVAVGSRPVVPPIPGLAEVDYWTTHDAIAASELPDSIIVLGGGAVGCELGQVFARLWVEVTIVEGRDRLLPAEEPEVSEVLASVFAAEGLAVHAGARVARVESRAESIATILEGGDELAADRLLIATGRAIELDGLGLEAAGLDPTAEPLSHSLDGVGAVDVDRHASTESTRPSSLTTNRCFQAPVPASRTPYSPGSTESWCRAQT